MRWTLPNILTVGRLFAAPCVPLAYILFPSPFADWVALVLFVTASLTDYFDGYFARKWNQISGFGRMLDPIADKVMVVLSLLVVMLFTGFDPLFLIPVTIILFREIFVSGLREFLGAKAGKLQVTKLAKWKTAVQMIAIAAVLLTHMLGIYVTANSFAMEEQYALQVMLGEIEGEGNLYMLYQSYSFVNIAGLVLIWLAAGLTLLTGIDYLRKSMPYLDEAT